MAALELLFAEDGLVEVLVDENMLADVLADVEAVPDGPPAQPQMMEIERHKLARGVQRTIQLLIVRDI
jgi:hypothetical protein